MSKRGAASRTPPIIRETFFCKLHAVAVFAVWAPQGNGSCEWQDKHKGSGFALLRPDELEPEPDGKAKRRRVGMLLLVALF